MIEIAFVKSYLKGKMGQSIWANIKSITDIVRKSELEKMWCRSLRLIFKVYDKAIIVGLPLHCCNWSACAVVRHLNL